MERNRPIGIPEQREIMLGILDYVIEYCKDNGLTYYLIGGSLIGAVRHRGFIPWDDDIDIALLRKDYDYLVRSFNANKTDRYELLDISCNPKFYLPYAKIIDNRTMLQENVHGICPVGVNIDVFPLDYISKEVQDDYQRRNLKKTNIEKIIAIKSIPLRADRSLWKNAMILFLRGLFPIPYTYYTKQRVKRASRIISKEPTGILANLYGAWGEREITDAENFRYPIDGSFEGRTVNLPNGYDEWLTHVYGNYMSLPPEEKRISHHDYTVVWK